MVFFKFFFLVGFFVKQGDIILFGVVVLVVDIFCICRDWCKFCGFFGILLIDVEVLKFKEFMGVVEYSYYI